MRDSRAGHARRLKIPVKVLEERYGWTIDRMMHDAKHAFENNCCYCNEPFKEMKRGLHDLTLDIVNPLEEPCYTTNTKWACFSCNQEKAQTPSQVFAVRMTCWRRYQKLKLAEREGKIDNTEIQLQLFMNQVDMELK